uniref:Uncharacterized protein n=1 Tax=Physcomitrium patens TaxID=3218 RepID=A0A2K1K301_PHYPA|nr:hypothetical protein PHYPA_012623 [Physcomitrium patens]
MRRDPVSGRDAECSRPPTYFAALPLGLLASGKENGFCERRTVTFGGWGTDLYTICFQMVDRPELIRARNLSPVHLLEDLTDRLQTQMKPWVVIKDVFRTTSYFKSYEGGSNATGFAFVEMVLGVFSAKRTKMLDSKNIDQSEL